MLHEKQRDRATLVITAICLSSIVACREQDPLVAPATVSAQVASAATDTSEFFHTVEGKRYPLVAQEGRFVVALDVDASRPDERDEAVRTSLARVASVRADRGRVAVGHQAVRLDFAAKGSAREQVRVVLAAQNVRFAMPVFRYAGDTNDIFPINRFVVKYRDAVNRDHIQQIERRYGLEIERRPAPDSGCFEYWYQYPKGPERLPLEIVSDVGSLPEVEWATPDWVKTGFQPLQSPVPNDPGFSLQYYLENESPRDSRRLHFVREWSHAKAKPVFPRGA